MADRLRPFALLALMLGLVGCDHATKLAARSWLLGKRPLALARGFLELRYTENHDTAFSLTRGFDLPARAFTLAALATLVLAGVLVMWWRRRRDAELLEQLAFAAIVAGALGNVTDRLIRGCVVDFIYVRPWPFYFNVADILVAVGVGLLLMAQRRQKLATSTA